MLQIGLQGLKDFEGFQLPHRQVRRKRVAETHLDYIQVSKGCGTLSLVHKNFMAHSEFDPVCFGKKYMTQTLFDKYGGFPAITTIVRDFYKRVMLDPQLSPYFANVSLGELIQHQIAFVAMAMGSTSQDYTGRSMKEAHQGAGITQASFELTVKLLSDALTAGGIEAADVDAIIASVKTLRADVVEH